MKQYIWQIILLFILTLIVFTFYSFVEYKVNVAGIELEKSEIKNSFTPIAPDTSAYIMPIFEGQTGLIPEKFYTQIADILKKFKIKAAGSTIDTSAQKILIIGDSMLEYLMLRLKDYTEQNGHTMNSVIWYSSQSEWYGKTDTLKYFINKYKPTYVWIVLGANELFIPKIKERRLNYVKKILKQIDTLKYVWIGPPNWKNDTGINDLILSQVGSKRYFPSKQLKYNRCKDGAHPTKESAFVWMDSIANWVMTKSLYPIMLKNPLQKRKSGPHAVLLMPLKNKSI